jgi:hypothetical protein
VNETKCDAPETIHDFLQEIEKNSDN